jgi:hypothetical protein
MKTKRVNRYYCDHCRKSGCNSSHIKAHEKVCCRNPDRACEMCKTEKRDYRDLVKQFERDGNTDALDEMVDGCPWCMLAIIIQCQSNPASDPRWDWDFKAEKERWDNEQMALRKEQDEWNAMHN